jgi:DNA-binding MarR family transcriptional regulator
VSTGARGEAYLEDGVEEPADDVDLAPDGEPPVEDEVSRIVTAWRRERPDLDVAPLEVLSRVSRLSRHLDRHRAAAFAGSGVEPWEFDVLAALRRSGPPYQLSPGTLIAETLVTSWTMTNRIDRLEARGLVHRQRDPDDGRGVLVRLTDPGRALVDTALAALLERERTLLTGLTERDRTTLAGLLRRLVAPFDAP